MLLGVVSLFADMTFDGAYSIMGPYLGILGASAVAIALIVGLGELVAYTPRLASGFFVDKTQRYWAIMIIGYAINLVGVPLLALVGHWELAAALIVMERVGKAIRAPARDAIISHAAKGMGGLGRAFGLHEALSQIGSMIGPIIVALTLHFNYGYQTSFAILFVPAVLAFAVLFLAIKWYPRPRELEERDVVVLKPKTQVRLPKIFWIYFAAAALVAAGFVDFPLIAYHLRASTEVMEAWIPVLFAIAMGVDALSALILGHFYDRIGIKTLLFVLPAAAFFMPLVFGTDLLSATLGMALWGLGFGAIESVMRGAVADFVPPERRGAGYGIYSTGFGVAWFLGSAVTGILYVISVPVMILTSMAMVFGAVAMIIWVRREWKRMPKIESRTNESA